MASHLGPAAFWHEGLRGPGGSHCPPSAALSSHPRGMNSVSLVPHPPWQTLTQNQARFGRFFIFLLLLLIIHTLSLPCPVWGSRGSGASHTWGHCRGAAFCTQTLPCQPPIPAAHWDTLGANPWLLPFPSLYFQCPGVTLSHQQSRRGFGREQTQVLIVQL